MDELLLFGLSMLRKARLLSQKPGFYQLDYSSLMLELRKKSIRALLEFTKDFRSLGDFGSLWEQKSLGGLRQMHSPPKS
jgi:hypothetical protein